MITRVGWDAISVLFSWRLLAVNTNLCSVFTEDAQNQRWIPQRQKFWFFPSHLFLISSTQSQICKNVFCWILLSGQDGLFTNQTRKEKKKREYWRNNRIPARAGKWEVWAVNIIITTLQGQCFLPGLKNKTSISGHFVPMRNHCIFIQDSSLKTGGNGLKRTFCGVYDTHQQPTILTHKNGQFQLSSRQAKSDSIPNLTIGPTSKNNIQSDVWLPWSNKVMQGCPCSYQAC